MIYILSKIVPSFASLDDIRRDLPNDLRILFADKVAEDASAWDFDLLIAGLNPTPFAWLLSSISRDGSEPFAFIDVGYFWGSPPIDLEDMERAARFMPMAPIAGRLILDAQRKAPDCWVGGYGQITTISEAGINTKLVCRWPDKVGEKIDRNAKASP